MIVNLMPWASTNTYLPPTTDQTVCSPNRQKTLRTFKAKLSNQKLKMEGEPYLVLLMTHDNIFPNGY